MVADKLHLYYMSVWLIMAFVFWAFFRFTSVKMRRKWHGVLTLVVGTVLGLFFIVMTSDWPTFPFVLMFVIPSLAVMMWWNSQKLRFCNGCEATLFPSPFRDPPYHCPKCGTSIFA
jgi:hypothetical protein